MIRSQLEQASHRWRRIVALVLRGRQQLPGADDAAFKQFLANAPDFDVLPIERPRDPARPIEF